ncbi:MAG: isoleucine--tRNA ligase, partial [Actinomycetota bacterium]
MSERLYEQVGPHVSFPELEEAVAARWAETDVFHRSLKQREGADEWVFYEGPPTANNKPGLHHVEARVFKDIFCRYQTMQGRYVHRKAGWDCHGLPVEVEVEKELGITNKRQIEEEVGIEEFVRRCRESVQRYVDLWEPFTARIGFWVDIDQAYWTMDASYVESVWWILKQIWDKGLLEEDFKVVPYCPRCETSLSNHEQHQTDAYQTVSDPSVYVRFTLVDEPQTSLLVWTTTPWTLLANMATAINPNVDYARVADPQQNGKHLILARELVVALLGEGTEILEEIPGQALVGKRYEPPFTFVESGTTGHLVYPADFVNTEEGTGLVHIAPYGEDDMVLAKTVDLPVRQMIGPNGRVIADGGDFAGLWHKEADPKIVADLEARGLLFRSELYSHAYPHCWRCGTPLLYFARLDWYIRTSQIRAELQASNEETNWQPPTIKYGRFGDWLANNVDWSLSRDRYWGTPLPIWRCEDAHAHCVGSFAELSELVGRDLSGIDPHRPWVDEITFACPECGKLSKRVASVIDTWFDSGSMPFAQWHYPFENENVFETRFPADFISEAIDQTRGWFYTLLAIATLVRGHNSYRNCVCLGHLVDTQGRKMSKSLGNVIDPWDVLNVQGADALRWYLLTGGTPWSPRRVSIEIIQEALRKYLLTLWNTYSFWVTYASLEGFDPTAEDIPVTQRSEMDRWILAELDDTIAEVTAGLDDFDPTRGGRRLDRFVDDLSNWYVRRSRRRFWRSGSDTDTRAAFLTLWECLVTVCRLSAPYTPFVADAIYTNLTGIDANAPDSVHLAEWPERDTSLRDDELRRRMGLVRTLVALGRSARTEAKVRVRQPLARALVVLPSGEAEILEGLEALVADELNVKAIEILTGMQELVTYSVKPNFKALGPRFGARMKDVARAIAEADPHDLVE